MLKYELPDHTEECDQDALCRSNTAEGVCQLLFNVSEAEASVYDVRERIDEVHWLLNNRGVLRTCYHSSMQTWTEALRRALPIANAQPRRSATVLLVDKTDPVCGNCVLGLRQVRMDFRIEKMFTRRSLDI